MGVFSKLAGGGVAKYVGILLMVLTLIPAIIKAFSVTIHQGKVAYFVWRGKVILHGHFMYPIRDTTRAVFLRPERPRLLLPPKPHGQGRSWYIPIWGTYSIQDTTDRPHSTTVFFFRQDVKLDCRLRYSAELQVVWGLKPKPILNPWYIPRDLAPHHMAMAMEAMEEDVGKLKGDILERVHDRFIYPWVAIFNPEKFEELALGLIKQAIMSVYSDPDFQESDFRNSERIYEQAERICRNRLLLLYAADLRDVLISDVSHEPVQTEPIAAAINRLSQGRMPDSVMDDLQDAVVNGFGRAPSNAFGTS